MNEKLGVETVTTAAESPFSNGICERHNAILFKTMSKTLVDTKCDPDLALAWAVSAKNALQNRNGFSPNQLVFGHNVNLPTVLTDLPPALESTTSSEIVRRNLNAMHNARSNYIQAEASEKIPRALKSKTRTFADQKYSVGDKVFYKRKNLKGWRRPAIVSGIDSNIILVRHGSAFYRCHPCHLMKVMRLNEDGKIPQCNEVFDENVAKRKGNKQNAVSDDDDDGDDDGDDDDDDDEDNNECQETTEENATPLMQPSQEVVKDDHILNS